MPGYDPDFLSYARLPLPQLTASQKAQRAPLLGLPKSFELAYTHFSVVMHKKRRFAFYAATNVDGKTWDALVENRSKFKEDERMAAEHQTGDALYDFDEAAPVNDFDKGHIAKFQDPQWGNAATIRQAADDTMKFPNCVPQHHSLNRGAWKGLEDYIVKKFTKKTGIDGSKVTVFAGPLLLAKDPFYIDAIEGRAVQIPCYFWKLIVYQNKQGQPSVVAFLMSQRALLFKHNIVVTKRASVKGMAPMTAEKDFFADFKSGEPYQITVAFLQTVTGFQFGAEALHQPFTKTEPAEIIFQRVELPVSQKGFAPRRYGNKPLTFTYKGITL